MGWGRFSPTVWRLRMPEASVQGCIDSVSAKASPNPCLSWSCQLPPKHQYSTTLHAACPHPNPLPQAGEGTLRLKTIVRANAPKASRLPDSRDRFHPWSRPANGRGDHFSLLPYPQDCRARGRREPWLGGAGCRLTFVASRPDVFRGPRVGLPRLPLFRAFV